MSGQQKLSVGEWIGVAGVIATLFGVFVPLYICRIGQKDSNYELALRERHLRAIEVSTERQLSMQRPYFTVEVVRDGSSSHLEVKNSGEVGIVEGGYEIVFRRQAKTIGEFSYHQKLTGQLCDLRPGQSATLPIDAETVHGWRSQGFLSMSGYVKISAKSTAGESKTMVYDIGIRILDGKKEKDAYAVDFLVQRDPPLLLDSLTAEERLDLIFGR